MEKLFIKNRQGQKICVVVDRVPNQKGIVFVAHGLSGTKDESHIELFAQTFVEKEFTAVRFDTTNTFGESDGQYEDATLTGYIHDLEDVIAWARTQEWFVEPFYLIGHSLGGFSVAWYAEHHSGQVKAVAPISPVVSGTLSEEAHKKFFPKRYEEWQETGWRVEERSSKPGTYKRLKWSHMVDRRNHSLLPDATKLTMPVLLVVGQMDTSILPTHVAQLHDAIPGNNKTYIVVPGVPHNFRSEKELSELKRIVGDWIDSVEEVR